MTTTTSGTPLSQGQSLSSYQTAIAIIPPAFYHPQINALRSLYDKSYLKWPPHINVLYPFVTPESLPLAVKKLQRVVQERIDDGLGFWLKLDRPGSFHHKQNATIFLSPGPHDGGRVRDPETASGTALKRLEEFISNQYTKRGRTGDGVYRPHLTLGQTSLDPVHLNSLLSKAEKLVTANRTSSQLFNWFVTRLAVMKRDEEGNMKVVDEILLGKGDAEGSEKGEGEEAEEDTKSEVDRVSVQNLGEFQRLGLDDPKESFGNVGLGASYQFSAESDDWAPADLASVQGQRWLPKDITIATYNVLIDSPFPPPVERYPLLINAILSIHPTSPSSATPSILCLQEVTDDFLQYLLSNNAIRTRYPLCTHSPNSVLPSIRNCVILATGSCGPFKWQWLDFAKRHKGAVIASFPKLGSPDRPLVVTTVHLTCGLGDGSVSAKASQLKALSTYLRTKHPTSEWIVAGDFNLQSSVQSIDSALTNRRISKDTYELVRKGLIDEEVFSDAWEFFFGSNEEDDVPYEADNTGATFNPFTNPVAAEIVRWSSDPRPQRYDRVLIKSTGNLRVRDVRRFGFPEINSQGCEKTLECGSDHWGVRAMLNFRPDVGDAGNQGKSAKLQLPETNVGDQLLKTIVDPYMPSRADHNAREAAITSLREVLLQEQESVVGAEHKPSRGAIPIILAPVGSYALGVYDKDSDVDCLCVSTISTKTFFEIARQRIRRFGGERGIRLIRFVDAKFPILEVKVGSIKFDLQHCQAPAIIEHWSAIPLLPPNDSTFSLPVYGLKSLNSYRDTEFLLRTIPNLNVFRLAYRFIKIWALASGIFSSRFGYLGGFHITLLLARVFKLADGDLKGVSASKIVRLFFDHYSKTDWLTEIIYDPEFPVGAQYQRFSREPMAITSIHTPVVNVARNATRHSIGALTREFELAKKALDDGQWDLRLMGRENDFLTEYGSYVKIDVQYWGNAWRRGKALALWVESTIPLFLVELNTKAPFIFARVWPQRFVSTAELDEWVELRGFYLVGLSNNATGEERSKEQKRKDENTFLEVLQAYEQHLKGRSTDILEHDSTDSWIQVQHVRKSSLGTVKVDERDWGDDGTEGDLMDNEDNSIGIEEDSDCEEYACNDDRSYLDVRERPSPKAKKLPKKPVPGKKLRPALDVINRIRWDPTLDSGDFLIGYEDRFKGIREMDVGKWKMEQTDLEFIPLHRVVYFKRRSDGVVVWDRETKNDILFGNEIGESGE
ncbi:hypothetical protein L873DRAFT_1826394 [Choiromyces venosus 120613-1]|uniref:polynucleotide adenylyltransferase n=1 Tax=Choiromyces venosus 120613-1 TaxID=1336337 RepID=A0A3N4JYD4_9PEZI|nr:hypothetical protein L873DRAFT_1826394 [Choiromyces venosus 120613-1]